MTYEIRRDESPRAGIDEVIVHEPRLVHFERMSDGAIWCGIELKDGRELHVDIGTGERCRHRLFFRAEEK